MNAAETDRVSFVMSEATLQAACQTRGLGNHGYVPLLHSPRGPPHLHSSPPQQLLQFKL